jgi:hypothetical protein
MAGMYGNFNFPQLPYSKFESGVDLGNALVLATGGNVVYLRSTGPADYDPPALTGRIVTTLSQALTQCRANKADTILVLPGHSEDVTSATALSGLVAGTRIIGVGQGSNAPTFTWKTATAASWAINVANVCITGLRLDFTGITAVASAITVTGADCSVSGCDVIVGTASAIPVIGVQISTGANRFQLAGNRIRGVHATGVTDSVVKVAAAVDGVELVGNRVYASATGNGVFAITKAATNIIIGGNIILNTQTQSTRGIYCSTYAASGFIHDNRTGVTVNGTANAGGIILESGATIVCAENYNSDESAKSGVLTPAAAT